MYYVTVTITFSLFRSCNSNQVGSSCFFPPPNRDNSIIFNYCWTIFPPFILVAPLLWIGCVHLLRLASATVPQPDDVFCCPKQWRHVKATRTASEGPGSDSFAKDRIVDLANGSNALTCDFWRMHVQTQSNEHCQSAAKTYMI